MVMQVHYHVNVRISNQSPSMRHSNTSHAFQPQNASGFLGYLHSEVGARRQRRLGTDPLCAISGWNPEGPVAALQRLPSVAMTVESDL
jgi:hypothetical protein